MHRAGEKLGQSSRKAPQRIDFSNGKVPSPSSKWVGEKRKGGVKKVEEKKKGTGIVSNEKKKKNAPRIWYQERGKAKSKISPWEAFRGQKGLVWSQRRGLGNMGKNTGGKKTRGKRCGKGKGNGHCRWEWGHLGS